MVEVLVVRPDFRSGVYRVVTLVGGNVWSVSEISTVVGVIDWIAGLANTWFGQVEVRWE